MNELQEETTHTAPPLGARVEYASDVREGDLLVLPQPPLVRVTKIRRDHVAGVEILIFQAEIAEMYLDWVYENGAPLSAKMVTFARWPFEAMQVFRRWDETDAPGLAD